MSSFNEFFEYNNKINDVQFESYSFYPFLETIIILLIIYFSYKLYLSLTSYDTKYQNCSEYINCQCEFCSKKLKKLIKKEHKNKYIKTYIAILLVLFYFLKNYYELILANQEKVKSFDPYEILEISPLANKDEIKKAFKKQALKYHPDKNKNDIDAKNKFILINKAYETLTNDKSKKNYELYGNPDGPISMRMSLGLPSFLLNKSYHKFILIGFLILICIIAPYKFIAWFNRTNGFESNGLFKSTKNIFKKSTNLNTTLANLPFILGSSKEFSLINEPHIKSEFTQINNLYDKYKNNFKNKEVLENIGYRIPLNYKKAIGIAYEYSFCDRTDKNYLKLHKINEYLNLLAKLIDEFIEAQKEKIFQLKLIKQYKININEAKTQEEKDLLNLEPIAFDFIMSCILYQQCFYQGIPITIIQKPFIPYIQLPHITPKKCETFKSKDVDITIEQFLKYADNEKQDIIKNIFEFNKTEIKDIIEASNAIPRYEYKIKSYVEGFEDTGFIKGDKVTFKLDITRKYREDKKFGILHSNCFPGIFKEFIYIVVFNGKEVLKMDKIYIDKKENEYYFHIFLGLVGTIPIKILVIPGNYYLYNDVINCEIKCEDKSEKREEMIKNIENANKNEKIEKSYAQQIISSIYGVEDEDEEEEIEDNENKDNDEKNEISTEKNENINRSAINNEENNSIIDS